jgi:hypothetical protein
VTETRWLLLAAVGFLVVNAAYAFALPTALEEFRPDKPHGIRAGESPTTEAGTTFVDVTEETGIEHTRHRWTSGDLPYPAVVTGGVAAGDANGDGWMDLYFPPGGPTSPAHLYVNQGNWTFRDATDEAGLNTTGWGAGAVFGDADGDGDPDLYALVNGSGILYENRGNLTFRNATDEAGLGLEGYCGEQPCQPSSATWADHDRDGDLDLYVVNNLDWRDPNLHTSGDDYGSLITFATAQRAVLFENQGNATFEEVTVDARVGDPEGKGLGVTVADHDGDGDPDLYTANDDTPNGLLLNQGDGTYQDVASAVGVDERRSSMGIVARDLDGDGDPDLAVSNFRGEGLSYHRQRSDGTYAYETRDRGLGASFRGTGWGVQAFDYDLDGDLDLGMAVGRAVPLAPHENDLTNIVFPELKRNAEDQLYRNLDDGWYAEATPTAGAFGDLDNTRALLSVDLDNDGDPDVVRVNVQGDNVDVLRNDLDGGHGWLRLDLEGRSSPTDGYGATVEVALPGDRTLTRRLVSASGYQTGQPSRLTVGLGDAQEARVTVHWPSGVTQDLGRLEAGAHTIVEPPSS